MADVVTTGDQAAIIAAQRNQEDPGVELHKLVQRIMKEQEGFLSAQDLADLVRLARLAPVLVRCGGCRFTAAAQDVAHLVGIIEREASDYVRDLSFPCWAPEKIVRGQFS